MVGELFGEVVEEEEEEEEGCWMEGGLDILV